MSEQELPRCHDCNAKVGQLHASGCDVERCPICGGQALSCDCFNEMLENDVEIQALVQAKFDDLLAKNGGRLPWTGTWPGEAECVEFGWYSKPDPFSRGWRRCDANDSEASPDLNRLAIEARWDSKKRRYVKK